MLKNPFCPKCKNNKRVIAHYTRHTPTSFMEMFKDVFKCNSCGEKFTGVRTDNPAEQMKKGEQPK
jgi:transposase-like protein